MTSATGASEPDVHPPAGARFRARSAGTVVEATEEPVCRVDEDDLRAVPVELGRCRASRITSRSSTTAPAVSTPVAPPPTTTMHEAPPS